MAILFNDILRVCTYTHVTYSVVNRVLKVVFQLSLGASKFLADRIVMDFISRPTYALSSLLLSSTSTYVQICGGVFSSRLLWVLRLL